MKNAISIKGTREGLTITLGSGEIEALLEDLGEHLKTQGAFFRGGRVALQIGDHAIDEQSLTQFNELLAQYEMILRTVVTTNAASQKSVRSLGLRLVAPGASNEGSARDTASEGPKRRIVRMPASSPADKLDGSKGVLVRHLVRSGQVVRHTGHVVVLGDVNIGAEIVAGGDIVIWGRLYGTVHAGAMGNDSAIVCALDFAPLQLRIGDHIARPGEDAHPTRSLPEIACVRDNMIVVEPWDRAPEGV